MNPTMDLYTSKDGLPPNAVYYGYQYPQLAPWGPFPDEIPSGNHIWDNGSSLAAPAASISDWSPSRIPASGDFISPAIWPAVETDSEACERHLCPSTGENAAISLAWSRSQPSSPTDAFSIATPPKSQAQAPSHLQPRGQKKAQSKQAARDSNKIAKSKPTPVPRNPARKPRKASASASSTENTRDICEESTSSGRVDARRIHNIVEKQYRNRLNSRFERLLSVLLPGDQESFPEDGEQVDPKAERKASDSSETGKMAGVRRPSKADILDAATNRITELEADRARLLREKELLQGIDIAAEAAMKEKACIGS